MGDEGMSGFGSEKADHEPWPARALILAALGALFGLLFSQLVNRSETALDGALAAALAVSGVVFALSLERARWHWATIFAPVAGMVAGFVSWWNGAPDGWGADEGWHLAASIAAAALAVPLFQAARDAGRARFAPAAVHEHAWTNLFLGGVAGAFAGVTVLLTLLLSELFALIGLRFLRDLIHGDWFTWTLACAAFGAALGLLKDREGVMEIVQRVVRAVLSVLAPLLAAGLLFFVLALPFTGVGALWEQTKATTPILLACMAGALVLTNAVAGNSPDEESKAPALRWSAMALIACLVPLAVVAALSISTRIAQHGFTPDRLWAAVFVSVAGAVAVGYTLSLVRGRSAWATSLRAANVRLAAAVCLLALFLALPIVSFGALSARDQVARLESGRISPAQFDWAALRFDFGPTGRTLLQRLAGSRSADLSAPAVEALAAKARWELPTGDFGVPEPRHRATGIKVLPTAAAVPPQLQALLFDRSDMASPCVGAGECLLYWKPGEETAVAVLDGCAASQVGANRQTDRGTGCEIMVNPVGFRDGRWQVLNGSAAQKPDLSAEQEQESLRRERAALDAGRVTIREVTRRQVFVGEEPVSQLFE